MTIEAALAPADFVTEEIASKVTGYSVRAIRDKRAKGVWLEGKEWVKAPDGKVLISMKGYAQWASKGRT